MRRRSRPKATPTSVSFRAANIFARLAIRLRYGCAGPLAVLPSACGNTTLNSIFASCSSAFLAQERQPAQVAVDLIEQVFRHDLVKTAVAGLDHLVEREDVVELAVVGLRPQVRVCAGQRPSKAPTSLCNRNRGTQTKCLTIVNCRNMMYDI